MITSPEDLKALSESRIVNKEVEGERKALSERIKENLQKTVYGDKTKEA